MMLLKRTSFILNRFINIGRIKKGKILTEMIFSIKFNEYSKSVFPLKIFTLTRANNRKIEKFTLPFDVIKPNTRSEFVVYSFKMQLAKYGCSDNVSKYILFSFLIT